MAPPERDLQQQMQVLYSDHHGWLQGWLRRKLGSTCDAADLAHDTYLRVVARGHAPEAADSRKHLAQIANGLMIDLFRRRRIEQAYLETLATFDEAQTPSLETRALIIESLIEIDAILSALPAKVRTAFLLCKLDGLSYREIAEQLGVTASSVEKYVARALLSLQKWQDRLDAVPAPLARQVLTASPGAVSAQRRRVLQAFGLAFSVGGGAWLLRETEAWQYGTSDYRSAPGAIRRIALFDGTEVVLDTASSIDVHYSAYERRIVLTSGAILVTSAAHNAQAPDPRPLLVQTRSGTVRAIGTRFSVRQHEHAVAVAVFDGVVELRPAQGDGRTLLLRAGQRSSFTSYQVQSVTAVDERAASWAEGRLVAESMPLGELVAELGRYRRGVLRCQPELAHVRVSGVFSLHDTDRALHNLTLALPVEIIYRTRYWVTLRARSTA